MLSRELPEIVEGLKKEGYSNDEITETFLIMLSMPMGELSHIINTHNISKIERALGGSIITMAATGNFYDLGYIISRLENKKTEAELKTNTKLN